MKRTLRALFERLITSFLPYYVSCWIIASASAVFVFAQFGFLYACIVLLSAFFVFEGLFRVLLYVSYGAHYRYAVFTYLLVDDPHYGTALRRGADSKRVPFPLFDIFAFPVGSGRITDPRKNVERRNAFTVNDLGFRGKPFDPHRKRAKLRIFCVGGSTTAGHCIDDDETWPVALERNLRAEGYDVEVVNAGVHGWTSYKDYLRYAREIVHYEPDIVLLHEGWNEEFLWSCLSLGKRWRPKLARNVREEHMLYSPPSRLLSSDRFFTAFLAIQAVRKKFIFKRNMSFRNPRRWRGLLRREYIHAWVENMLEIARIAREKGTLLYTVDYPGLVSMDDTDSDREVYVGGSRLTPRYADYQAVSKERISEALSLCSPVIPVIRAVEDFASYAGKERLPLFLDEIHLTPRGNALLGKAVASRLIADPEFQVRYANASKTSNVHFDASIREILTEAGRNGYGMERFVRRVIEELEGGHGGGTADIPTERYTTF